MEHPRSILRSNTQSTTNTTKRVTWADAPYEAPRRPPPSIIPPPRVRKRVAARSTRPRSRASSLERRNRGPEHTRPKHQHGEKVARRRRRAEGVVKRRTGVDVRRTEVKKKKKKKKSSSGSDAGKKKRKCKRGLVYVKDYLVTKCQIKDGDMLDVVTAKTLYKIYAEVRRRLGKKVDEGIRKRMVEEERTFVEDRRIIRRKRRNLEGFVNKWLPGVRAEAFSRSQLSKAAFAAIIARFERVHRDRR